MTFDAKERLLRSLRASREGLLSKVEGLSERELRLPRTPTGTSLLGLLKHCAHIEFGYFVTCFNQPSSLVLPEIDFDADPNGDLYASAEESAEGLIALFNQVSEITDEVIERLPLDTPGHVEWWGEQGATTFGAVLVHVINDVTRHAGQADIIRELIDGAAGLRPGSENLWEPTDGWAAHVARLTELAENA